MAVVVGDGKAMGGHGEQRWAVMSSNGQAVVRSDGGGGGGDVAAWEVVDASSANVRTCESVRGGASRCESV